jgi:DNA (cytosine-5)-methyltransferase 1
MTQLTFLWAEPHANRSVSRDFAKEWMIREETSRSPILQSLTNIAPDGWFGRTSPASCPATEDGILVPSSGRWANSGMGSHIRVLDAQYFGVAQRRRRVFVVGYLGDWRRAAAVLFERESLSGHPAPSREAREEIAQCITTRTGSAYDPTTETLPISAPIAFESNMSLQTPSVNNVHPTLTRRTHAAVAFGWQNSASQGDSVSTKVTPTLDKSKTPAVVGTLTRASSAGGTVTQQDINAGHILHSTSAVRRLTPRECERLQGFPDDYTLVPHRNKPAADGPRYKSLGNSMAVPVMRWIGERIQHVEGI